MREEDKKMLIEMKDNCLNASVYDDENRLLKANAITNVLKEIERLNNIINELEKFLDEEYEFADTKVFPGAMAGVAMGQINRTKNKLQELKGSNGAIPPEVIGTNGENGGLFDYGDR